MRALTVRLYGGSVLRLPRDNSCATEIYVTRGNIDWGSERLLMHSLDSNGAFLDVGAHIGYYALMAARSYLRCTPLSRTPALYRT